MKQPKLFGIFLGVNGSVLLVEMTSASRDADILRILRATRTEAFFPQKRFDGSEIACVTNAYALQGPGYRNDLASHICGGDVYGNVIVLKVNDIGFKVLMNHQKARKIMESIQNEYLFY